MKKDQNIPVDYKGGVVRVIIGEQDTKDDMHLIGEYGNFLSQEDASPNANTATEVMLLELGKEHGCSVLPGGLMTRQILGLASETGRGFRPPPNYGGRIKYLVVGPISVTGTVNKVLNTLPKLKNVNEDRYFVNESIYDHKGNLIKGFKKDSYQQKLMEIQNRPANFYVS